MIRTDVSSALAAEHISDLRSSASRSRLSALAACCRPAAWRRAAVGASSVAHGFGSWLRRGQLNPSRGGCGC